MDGPIAPSGPTAWPASDWGQSSEGFSVAVQADGEIVIGGASGCPQYGCTKAPALARLTEAGHPDPNFGHHGHEFLHGRIPGEEPRVDGLSVGPNEEVFAVCGGGASPVTIQRLGPSGELDRSFGRGGSLVVGEGAPAERFLFTRPKIEMTSSGKIVVGAEFVPDKGADDMVAFRYLANGRPDPSFGQNGHVVVNAGLDAFTRAIAVLPSEGVVLAGGGVGKGNRYFLIAALRPDGGLDPAVANGGIAKVQVASNGSATALALQPKVAIAVGYRGTPKRKNTLTLLARVPLSP